MGRDAPQLEILVSPTASRFGTKKVCGPFRGPSETNKGPTRHTAGTAIFQNAKGRGGSHTRTGPGCAPAPPPPRRLQPPAGPSVRTGTGRREPPVRG